MVHATFSSWVNVTNSTEGGQLSFSVISEGEGFTRIVADMAEITVRMVEGVAHVPLLGADMANLLLVLLQ